LLHNAANQSPKRLLKLVHPHSKSDRASCPAAGAPQKQLETKIEE
jgi:hypothetical protein